MGDGDVCTTNEGTENYTLKNGENLMLLYFTTVKKSHADSPKTSPAQ